MTADKWRPPLALVVAAVLLIVLALPLLGLLFFQLYGNQLVRQTEESLIGQAKVLAAAFAQAVPGTAPLGLAVQADLAATGPLTPQVPALDLAAGPILPRRADGLPPLLAVDPAYAKIGQQLAVLATETQKVTLAGFRITDPNGTVIGASGADMGLSLAHVPEVAQALRGEFAAALRLRSLNRVPPPFYSVSRGTQVRVFVALPVVVRGRVAGVVYASRTPNNVLKNLFAERGKVALASLAVLTATALIGFLFWRAVTRPIRELMQRARALGEGDRAALAPLRHHGTREVAQLAASLRGMAEALFRRTDHMRTFAAHVTHELKSPLTSIQGAAELLCEADGSMTKAQRDRFLGNILSDTGRMTQLVTRLRELAEAEAPETGGSSSVAEILPDLRLRQPALKITATGDPALVLPLNRENLLIVLGHLAENAARNGAIILAVAVSADPLQLLVRDNGGGVSPNNRDRLFDAFFTTHRETGGTGMGLGIVRALLRGHGGEIELAESAAGATFRITLPTPA